MFRIRKTQVHFIFLLSSTAQSPQTEEFMWLIDKLNIKLGLKPSLKTNQAFFVLFVNLKLAKKPHLSTFVDFVESFERQGHFFESLSFCI